MTSCGLLRGSGTRVPSEDACGLVEEIIENLSHPERMIRVKPDNL